MYSLGNETYMTMGKDVVKCNGEVCVCSVRCIPVTDYASFLILP